MNISFRIYPVGTGLLSEAERSQIAEWHEAEFSHLPVTKKYEWTVGGDYNILLDVNGEFVGYVGVMRREILLDSQQRLIAAVRGLVIDPQWRSQGLGMLLMKEAHKVIFSTLKVEYGVLLCLDELVPFYRTLGWQTLACQVFVENQGRKVPWSEMAMILTPGEEVEVKEISEVDLMGKAF
ncbi:MAG: GNAT family N-acetyltransferase [Planctomycetaceae bacterium]